MTFVNGIMTSKLSFSSPFIEKFVLLVKANPVLYNVLDANYKNISLRNSIWKDISLEIEKSVDETKKMWENIRDLYSKIIARKLETGTSFNKKKIWILTYRLSFLDQDECGLKLLSKISMDMEIEKIQEGMNNLLKWYSKDFSDDFTNRFKQFLSFSLNSNLTITEMHNPCTFHKEKGIVELLNKTEDDWPIESIIKNCHISKFNQNDKNLFENSNKPRTLNQKTQIKNKQFSTEEVNQIDDMDLFFENVSLKAKQFSSTGRIEAKMKICALMNELEEKYLIREPPLRPQLIKPIYLFTNIHIPTAQNNYSSSSSIQSCTSTLPSLHSDSESFCCESSDDSSFTT